MTEIEVQAIMGEPRRTQRLDAGVRHFYGWPAMADLPFLPADKAIELEMTSGEAGLILEEADCSGVDG